MNLREWAKAAGKTESEVVAAAKELGFDSAKWNSSISAEEDAALLNHFASADVVPAESEEPPVVVPVEETPAKPDKPVKVKKNDVLGAAEGVLAGALAPMRFSSLTRAMMDGGWQPEEGSHPREQVRDEVRRDCVENPESTRFVLGHDEHVGVK